MYQYVLVCTVTSMHIRPCSGVYTIATMHIRPCTGVCTIAIMHTRPCTGVLVRQLTSPNVTLALHFPPDQLALSGPKEAGIQLLDKATMCRSLPKGISDEHRDNVRVTMVVNVCIYLHKLEKLSFTGRLCLSCQWLKYKLRLHQSEDCTDVHLFP